MCFTENQIADLIFAIPLGPSAFCRFTKVKTFQAFIFQTPPLITNFNYYFLSSFHIQFTKAKMCLLTVGDRSLSESFLHNKFLCTWILSFISCILQSMGSPKYLLIDIHAQQNQKGNSLFNLTQPSPTIQFSSRTRNLIPDGPLLNRW